MGFPKAAPALLLFSVPFTFLPLASAAAEESETTRELDPIVVTATLGPRTVGESLSSVTVIDEKNLEQLDPRSMGKLLTGQPGIDVVSNGSFGKNTSVFTRGTGSQSTLFLVDGIRLRSATSGSAPWQYFPVELVERVEIVRGPRSSLYGADAVGGVVQAFTLDPEQGRKGWVEVGAGNFDSQKVSAGVSATAGSTRLSLSGLHTETDGTAIIEEGEDKGFRNSAGVGRVVHELPNGGEASMVLMQSEGNTEFESGNSDFMIRTLGLGLDTPLSDYWFTEIALSESRDELESFGTFGDSVFDTRNRTARWVNTLTMGVHELALGAELQVDEVKSSTQFDENSRNNAAVFSQLRLNFGPSDVQLALRADDNEAFGKVETGGLTLGHAIDQTHRVRFSYATSFRAPTFNELYFPLETFNFPGFQGSFAGNPGLQAEEGESVELGFRGQYNRWFWDMAVYQLDVDDLISNTDINDDPAVGDLRPTNVEKARIRGLELASGFETGGWSLAGKITLMDPRDEKTDNRLARRTHQSARLDVDRELGVWTLGGSVVAQGYRYDDPENEFRLPGFATLDLRAAWKFAKNWKLKLDVGNVLDNEYSTAIFSRSQDIDYIAAGRHGMLSVRYSFQ